MKKCPLFGVCGGCKFDFTSENYFAEKEKLLKNVPITENPVWIQGGLRRRADFAFLNNKIGFFESGSKNIIPVNNCPLLIDPINKIIPVLEKLPFQGSGSILVTLCDNGIDIAINSDVPYFNSEFKKAAEKIPAIRITWNEKIIKQLAQPIIKFADKSIDYKSNSFLQPSKEGENILRNIVNQYASESKKIVDLFSGSGSFTFSLNAIGYDIAGNGIKRDLFKKPLKVSELNKYDCVVMDPPRTGALEQVRELAKSNVDKIIYVSCNIDTFMRDKTILEKGNFKLLKLTPVDQFVGASGWELVAFFVKNHLDKVS